MIDTHAHLDSCDDPPDVVVGRARAAGVGRILTVGTTIESGRNALRLAEEHEEVFAIIGVHPNEVDAEGERIAELGALLAHPSAVAVGETGLDFYRDHSTPGSQLAAFRHHLGLAGELGKPVVIHTRAADAETEAELVRFGGTVVLHCFSSPALLPAALEHGWYVSFAGNVTYRNASELRVAAQLVPADRLLAETDSPYLSPQPVRGTRNEPANVMHTLAALATTRGVAPEELAATIDANAATAFGLP